MAWTSVGYSPESCGEAVLLLGNGLNWAGEGPSWSELLSGLRSVTGFPNHLDEATPFPLLYEEMYLHGIRSGVPEAKLLQAVSTHAKRIPVTPLLKRLHALPVKHLLTTNYDSATEKAFFGEEGQAAAPVSERRYSVLRRREYGDRVVWPIHGESRRVGSIMLGYEHYSGYLEQIRRYVTRGVKYQGRPHRSLTKSLSAKRGLDLVRSWVDFFFTKHVVILGLTLDLQELHLWWLLTYRARRRAEGKRYASQGKITFIHGPLPETNEQLDPETVARRERMLRIGRLLRAAGVELCEVRTASPTDRTVYFHSALDEAERLFSSA